MMNFKGKDHARYVFHLLSISLFLMGCEASKENESVQWKLEHYLGSYNPGQWETQEVVSFQTGQGPMQYDHLVDLKSRKVLLTRADSVSLGFDGEDVWVAPSKSALSLGGRPPRFFYNLPFYFFAIPYVYLDDGVIVDSPLKKKFGGRLYDMIRVTFKPGVGDTPKDEYLNYFDPTTQELKFLLYTVTYYSGKANEDYYATIYDTWQLVDGVKVPEQVSYAFLKDDSLDVYMTTRYSSVTFSKKSPPIHLFERPAQSEIDTLIHSQEALKALP